MHVWLSTTALNSKAIVPPKVCDIRRQEQKKWRRPACILVHSAASSGVEPGQSFPISPICSANHAPLPGSSGHHLAGQAEKVPDKSRRLADRRPEWSFVQLTTASLTATAAQCACYTGNGVVMSGRGLKKARTGSLRQRCAAAPALAVLHLRRI
ncbi:uncharacterized protein BDR25DRAFT_28411 [Lindgomyces ingoldianus]|uniref:Uncharacterized protein n=1 Tax=Lindgomyces ingoldianus TaxID=673940 RepID=A0ACB6QV86_9PLEO|nr:uncharacterized protein BDR25DRAFT_28411 [Lindgomyces ingoldianus]KAF2470944.1 hypothetical protein BDR25DRAFT_28411 [Lindgomyces ingoldianus]